MTITSINEAYAKANGRRIRLTLPYPPSVNRMYRAFRGRQILSREGRAFKDRTASLAIGANPLSGDVRVTLGVYRPAKRGDLDNTMKAILDALRGVAYFDDKQVIAIDAERFDDKREPRVEVMVEEELGVMENGIALLLSLVSSAIRVGM